MSDEPKRIDMANIFAHAAAIEIKYAVLKRDGTPMVVTCGRLQVAVYKRNRRKYYAQNGSCKTLGQNIIQNTFAKEETIMF